MSFTAHFTIMGCTHTIDIDDMDTDFITDKLNDEINSDAQLTEIDDVECVSVDIEFTMTQELEFDIHDLMHDSIMEYVEANRENEYGGEVDEDSIELGAN